MRTKISKKILSKLKGNKKHLESLQNLSLDAGKELLSSLPDGVAMCLYAKNCSIDELKQLKSEWIIKSPGRVRKLKQALKKEHRWIIGF